MTLLTSKNNTLFGHHENNFASQLKIMTTYQSRNQIIIKSIFLPTKMFKLYTNSGGPKYVLRQLTFIHKLSYSFLANGTNYELNSVDFRTTCRNAFGRNCEEFLKFAALQSSCDFGSKFFVSSFISYLLKAAKDFRKFSPRD